MMERPRSRGGDGKEPLDRPKEAWYWAGVTTFIVGLDQSTTPNVDSATDDVWWKEGRAWIRAHAQPIGDCVGALDLS